MKKPSKKQSIIRVTIVAHVPVDKANIEEHSRVLNAALAAQKGEGVDVFFKMLTVEKFNVQLQTIVPRAPKGA